MKSIFTALLIIVISSSSYSQGVDLFRRNLDVHVDLVPVIFPDPAIRFGSEMMLGKRWSAGLNLGVGTYILGNRAILFSEPSWNRGYQLFEIRPEIKFYWFKREKMGWYIAAEGLLSSMKASTGKGYHFANDSDSLEVVFDRADFQKTKIGLIGKMGGRFLFNDRITLDFFTGLGLSNTNSSYSNYVNLGSRRSDPFFEGENYTVGERITAHLSFGLRIGMLVWTKKEE
ncbi:DUF3575 domain-containing protein [Dyadobacter sp. CY345]|uniref:DUF3575 domain-containing protein n=1 Tax=Dyadobacter sp. CY345 TaxID=2909335 RepID=UPI001F38165F|nr:DUF3575 domain-containing protein [Dyadobacter sp. CY345]MCF2443424.1 DUF3575 domain-containing protein [Dyadobacter sp. CY345]